MFIFDLPVEQKKARDSLLRWLKRNRFGYLQDSVWISPDPVTEVVQSLKGWEEDAATFTLLESRCAAGFSDSALVAGAWQFSKVNERYDAYLRFANPALRRAAGARLHPRDLFAALREEGQRWSAAFDRDPLLPRVLWPKEYGGEEAWKLRQRLLRTLAVHAAR
jgi:phenylacetic acid degradation operon negative regulatory protein